MPTYESKCSACGHAFEKFQSITAAPIKACPQCGKNKARRLIGTGAGLIFKGSGFYITDYRSDSYKSAAKSDSSSSSGSTSNATTNSTSSSASSSTGPATTSGGAASSKPAPAPVTGKSGKKK